MGLKFNFLTTIKLITAMTNIIRSGRCMCGPICSEKEKSGHLYTNNYVLRSFHLPKTHLLVVAIKFNQHCWLLCHNVMASPTHSGG